MMMEIQAVMVMTMTITNGRHSKNDNGYNNKNTSTNNNLDVSDQIPDNYRNNSNILKKNLITTNQTMCSSTPTLLGNYPKQLLKKKKEEKKK